MAFSSAKRWYLPDKTCKLNNCAAIIAIIAINMNLIILLLDCVYIGIKNAFAISTR